MWRFAAIWMFAGLLTITIACSKKPASDEVIVEIPAGFSGNFVLEMGVRDAAPLARQGDAYVVAIPRSGKAQTSSLLNHARVTFRNSSDGQVWGFSQRVFTTGDGISIGGKIEFFVGTQKGFDAEQQKKNKSGGFFNLEASFAAA
jgi:hypothetical protein